MDSSLLTTLSFIGLVLLSGGTALYLAGGSRRASHLLDTLGNNTPDLHTAIREMQSQETEEARIQFEKIKEATRAQFVIPGVTSWQNRFFRAGWFAPAQQQLFRSFRIFLPIVLVFATSTLAFSFPLWITIGCTLVTFAIGLQLPISILDRAIERRNEEIMFYLPLVVEQLVIGVSSSLDISPCIRSVVTMADERDAHNPVTELLRHVQNYLKSGASLEESLNEVGALSGHIELKHVFMSLAQVSKHGGEITRQLQELANAVAQQRESRIEARIRKLELEATGPVGLVFLAFLGVLMVGLGAQVLEVFK